MDNSLVLGLQMKALDSNVSIADLLRQAFVLSKKLQIPAFESWIAKELNGYLMDDEIPKYRNIQTEVKAFNPYSGWNPVMFQDPKMAEYLSTVPMIQPITEIDSFVNSKGSDMVLIKFTHESEVHMREQLGMNVQLARHASKIAFEGILDAVRNALLKWTMDLEVDNILVEGMVVTKAERETAQIINYNIQNYIGSVNHSSIQQELNNSINFINYNELH